MNFCEDSRILRNRVNVPPAQVQLKQNRLKRSAELNVLDGHCDNIDNNKPFHESDEPSSKRYATHQDTNNSTIIKEMSTVMTIDSAKKPCAILSNLAQSNRPPPLFFEEKSENCEENNENEISFSKTMLVSSSKHEFQSQSVSNKLVYSNHSESTTIYSITGNQINCKEADNATDADVVTYDEYDFDKDSETDVTALAHYAKDIFEYLIACEECFQIPNYFSKHPLVNNMIRAQLVAWFVDVQESLELNHETLYIATKLFDMFMSKTRNIKRNQLQLIGAAVFLVASKFEESEPPSMDDFLYLVQYAFTIEDLMKMERIVCRIVDLNLGIPLSYSFLRRYSRVTKAEGFNDMTTLTLARYILETSLMFLDFCRARGSLVAAASFSLALRMRKMGDWTTTLHKYSGYSKEDIEEMVWALNHMIIQTNENLRNMLPQIYEKYSHKVFKNVALIESLDDPLKKAQIKPPSKNLPENET